MDFPSKLNVIFNHFYPKQIPKQPANPYSKPGGNLLLSQLSSLFKAILSNQFVLNINSLIAGT